METTTKTQEESSEDSRKGYLLKLKEYCDKIPNELYNIRQDSKSERQNKASIRIEIDNRLCFVLGKCYVHNTKDSFKIKTYAEDGQTFAETKCYLIVNDICELVETHMDIYSSKTISIKLIKGDIVIRSYSLNDVNYPSKIRKVLSYFSKLL